MPSFSAVVVLSAVAANAIAVSAAPALRPQAASTSANPLSLEEAAGGTFSAPTTGSGLPKTGSAYLSAQISTPPVQLVTFEDGSICDLQTGELVLSPSTPELLARGRSDPGIAQNKKAVERMAKQADKEKCKKEAKQKGKEANKDTKGKEREGKKGESSSLRHVDSQETLVDI